MNVRLLSWNINSVRLRISALKKVVKKFKPNILLEIGSNDGAFLGNFDKKRVIGVEPCKNLANITIKKGYKIFPKYLETSGEVKKSPLLFDLTFSLLKKPYFE